MALSTGSLEGPPPPPPSRSRDSDCQTSFASGGAAGGAGGGTGGDLAGRPSDIQAGRGTGRKRAYEFQLNLNGCQRAGPDRAGPNGHPAGVGRWRKADERTANIFPARLARPRWENSAERSVARPFSGATRQTIKWPTEQNWTSLNRTGPSFELKLELELPLFSSHHHPATRKQQLAIRSARLACN